MEPNNTTPTPTARGGEMPPTNSPVVSPPPPILPLVSQTPPNSAVAPPSSTEVPITVSKSHYRPSTYRPRAVTAFREFPPKCGRKGFGGSEGHGVDLSEFEDEYSEEDEDVGVVTTQVPGATDSVLTTAGNWRGKYRPRAVTAFREFPPNCGRKGFGGSEGHGVDLSEFEDEYSEEDEDVGVVTTQVPGATDSVLTAAGNWRGKYRPRAVTAFREFPPNCGRKGFGGSEGHGEIFASSGVDLSEFEDEYSEDEDEEYARLSVKRTLGLFNDRVRKDLVLRNEGNEEIKNINARAETYIKRTIGLLNGGKAYQGSIPGVLDGDVFHSKRELYLAGIHRYHKGDIDWMKHDGLNIAVSILLSVSNLDGIENGGAVTYTSKALNIDETLQRGNLALNNSMERKLPVRVVIEWSETTEQRYVYSGLYNVVHYETEVKGENVFHIFRLSRMDDINIDWREVKRKSQYNYWAGVCGNNDLSYGKEPFLIPVVNYYDDEESPAPFYYVSSMNHSTVIYDEIPDGCTCIGKCEGGAGCSCAVLNGGQMPYFDDGSLKCQREVVYECGPACSCSTSCYNRTTQRGMAFGLEVFKTEFRGWGLRPLTSVPIGRFICEYTGEFLDERKNQISGTDEYLFDVKLKDTYGYRAPEDEVLTDYMIDAKYKGNVGRFINHSCSPNLYAQTVFYDNKKKPHIMLFSVKRIRPLEELTLNYNYELDGVVDPLGNVKTKDCLCGSEKCRKRLY